MKVWVTLLILSIIGTLGINKADLPIPPIIAPLAYSEGRYWFIENGIPTVNGTFKHYFDWSRNAFRADGLYAVGYSYSYDAIWNYVRSLFPSTLNVKNGIGKFGYLEAATGRFVCGD